jgi:endonuclease-8
MPEGDTILRTARTLARVLEGQKIEKFRSPLGNLADAALPGRTVVRVEPRGKHLLFHLDDGRALHSHMRMTGSWHVYRPGETWWKAERLARAVLETDAFVVVCFSAPVVELLSVSQLARHASLVRLGPDILSPGFNAGEALARLRSLGETPIGEALLAQSAVAGIGNIYKSESLFAARVSPFLPMSRIADADVERVISTARSMMRANVEDVERVARRRRSSAGASGPPYRVYERSGRPCLVCGTRIRMRRQADKGRSTYWCPACQSDSGNPSSVPP